VQVQLHFHLSVTTEVKVFSLYFHKDKQVSVATN